MGETSVLQGADLGYSEELAIFSKPIQNVGVNGVTFVPYLPKNEFITQGVIEWRVEGSGQQYLDLSRTRLAVRCQVVKKTKPALYLNQRTDDSTALGKVGPINNFLHSLWSRVDVSLQDKLLTSADTNYSYLAYLETLLANSKAAKEGYLESVLFKKDSAEFFNAKDPVLGGNSGLKWRSEFVENSNIFDLSGPLLADVTQIQKYIPNGIPLNVKLYPTSSEWRLMSAESDPDYEVKVISAVLHVAKVSVQPEILLAHSQLLKEKMAFFPYTKTEIKKFGLPKGAFSFTLDDPWQGRVPTEIVMGLVSEAAEAGSYELNGFNFEHANLSYLQVTVDGQEISNGAIEPVYPSDRDGTKGNYLEAWMSLYRGQNLDGGDIDLDISRTDYPFGYCLYILRTDSQTVSLEDPDFLPLIRKGNVRVTLRFRTQLEKPFMLITAAKFPSGFKVDATRAVYPM